ncbi:hypothetical protein [Streptomyces sp. LaBMicrA B280]|uniref:hypothetical protein n=1 Tax=Streptomyces sp. LaBMicrA B280 TaxID=3391001 RepID=UPI003BA3E335
MTADARTEFRTLHYGDELTAAHVDGLTDFLTTKLRALVSTSEKGTEAHRAAEALHTIVQDIAAGARHGIRNRDADLARGLDSSWTLSYRQEVRREWNRLVDIADCWRGTTDAHRYAPWTRVEHHNAENEAQEAADRAAETAGGDSPAYAIPADEPEVHSDHITREHLDALHGFLKKHTDQLLALHQVGTEEHRSALALETAVDMTRDDVHGSLTYDTDLDRDLESRRDAWNRLRHFALPWQDDPDFDTSRWPRAKYIPLRAAEERLPVQNRTVEGSRP